MNALFLGKSPELSEIETMLGEQKSLSSSSHHNTLTASLLQTKYREKREVDSRQLYPDGVFQQGKFYSFKFNFYNVLQNAIFPANTENCSKMLQNT